MGIGLTWRQAGLVCAHTLGCFLHLKMFRGTLVWENISLHLLKQINFDRDCMWKYWTLLLFFLCFISFSFVICSLASLFIELGQDKNWKTLSDFIELCTLVLCGDGLILGKVLEKGSIIKIVGENSGTGTGKTHFPSCHLQTKMV